jgi:hypothetical protein
MSLHKKRLGSILSGVGKTTEKDPLAAALDRLASVLAETRKGIEMQPVIHVDVPDMKPSVVVQPAETARPKKIRFTINRDRDGRISSIDAETK